MLPNQIQLICILTMGEVAEKIILLAKKSKVCKTEFSRMLQKFALNMPSCNLNGKERS